MEITIDSVLEIYQRITPSLYQGNGMTYKEADEKILNGLTDEQRAKINEMIKRHETKIHNNCQANHSAH